MTHRYDDILSSSHPTSDRHPRMPLSGRAAIFSPFAAVAGHEVAIRESARLTGRRIELEEDARAELDRKQRILEEHLADRPEITVTRFRPDGKKAGGSYERTTGRLKQVDGAARVLVLTDGTRIPMEDILDMEGECLYTAGPEKL